MAGGAPSPELATNMLREGLLQRVRVEGGGGRGLRGHVGVAHLLGSARLLARATRLGNGGETRAQDGSALPAVLLALPQGGTVLAHRGQAPLRAGVPLAEHLRAPLLRRQLRAQPEALPGGRCGRRRLRFRRRGSAQEGNGGIGVRRLVAAGSERPEGRLGSCDGSIRVWPRR